MHLYTNIKFLPCPILSSNFKSFKSLKSLGHRNHKTVPLHQIKLLLTSLFTKSSYIPNDKGRARNYFWWGDHYLAFFMLLLYFSTIWELYAEFVEKIVLYLKVSNLKSFLLHINGGIYASITNHPYIEASWRLTKWGSMDQCQAVHYQRVD